MAQVVTRPQRAAFLAGALVLAGAGPVLAQSETQSDGGGGRETEVVVTAERRATALQDTPLSITALTSERLEVQGIDTIEDVQFNTPNLTFGSLANFTLISLRGVGLDLTSLAGETSVATFLDGVYQGQTFVQNVPSFDLERIEVLRGPQGTLYGRNSTGGAINFITRDPSETFEANAALLAGEYSRFGADLGLTGPLGPNAQARASVRYESRDGYRKNLFNGQDFDDLKSWSARGALNIEPSESFDLILRADYTSRESSPVRQAIQSVANPGQTPELPLSVFSLPGPVLAGLGPLFSTADIARLAGRSPAQFFGLAQPGRFTDPTETTDFFNDAPNSSEFTVAGTSATATWEFGNVTLKSITGYRDSEVDNVADQDGTSAPILTVDYNQNAQQFTQEFDLLGEAADGKFEWLVGAFYFDEDAAATFDFFLPALTQLINLSASATNPAPPPLYSLSLPLGGGSIVNFVQLGADPVLGRRFSTNAVPSTAYLGFRLLQQSTSAAIFSQGTVHLSDDLRVTGGLRYTRDEKTANRSLHSNFVPAAALCTLRNESKSWEATTGTASLDYDVNDDTLVYGRVSKGYKAGGFNPGECAGAFDPESIWAYEAGLKAVTLGGQLLANTSLFYYDYKDIQFTTFIGNASLIRNAAGATVWGAEVEFGISPDAAPDFQVDGSLAYLKSEYDSARFQDPFNLATQDIGGNQLIRAPEWKANVAAQYTWRAGGLGAVTLRGETAYSAEYFHDIFNGKAPNQSATKEDAYTISNLRLIWSPENEVAEVQAFVENIEDTIYAYGRPSSGTSGNIAGEFSPPRTYGVRVAFKWGG
jgi:iron complex outermembrane receptor protein